MNTELLNSDFCQEYADIISKELAMSQLVIAPKKTSTERITTTDGREFNYLAVALAVQMEINEANQCKNQT